MKKKLDKRQYKYEKGAYVRVIKDEEWLAEEGIHVGDIGKIVNIYESVRYKRADVRFDNDTEIGFFLDENYIRLITYGEKIMNSL